MSSCRSLPPAIGKAEETHGKEARSTMTMRGVV
jgi:hypothetical protein